MRLERDLRLPLALVLDEAAAAVVVVAVVAVAVVGLAVESTTVVGLVPSLTCALTLKPTSSLGGVDLLELLLEWKAGSSAGLWEKWHLSPRRHPLDEKWNRLALLLTLASLGRWKRRCPCPWLPPCCWAAWWWARAPRPPAERDGMAKEWGFTCDFRRG